MDNREIDRLIAEKVMGWIIVDEHDHVGFPDTSGLSAIETIPNYSIKIADAWQVVLKVCEVTKWYEFDYRPTGATANFTGDIWNRVVVPFSQAQNDRTRAQCRAICLAALKAVGIEVE